MYVALTFSASSSRSSSRDFFTRGAPPEVLRFLALLSPVAGSNLKSSSSSLSSRCISIAAGGADAAESAFRSNTAPIPCTCHEKSTLDQQNTRFPLRLPRKVATVPKNAQGTTTRVQSQRAPAAATQILRACAVEMHFEDFKSRGMNVL